MNLFDGYSESKDEEIKDQIAMMRSISFYNSFKIKASETRKKVTDFFNKISDKVSDKVDDDSILNYKFRFKEKEVKKMNEYLIEEKEKLEFMDREVLDQIIKEELLNRIESDRFDDLNISQINKKELSEEIIKTAARWKELKLEDAEKLDSAKKVEIISNKFNSILIQKIDELEDRLNEEEKKEVDRKINKNLNSYSKKEREAIKKSLNIDELSGEVLRKTLVNAGGPMAAIGVVQLSGIGAYIALTTVMNALFTTVLGITIPFGVYTTATSGLALLAGPLGWLLVLGFGGKQVFKGKKTINRLLLVQAVWFSYNRIEYESQEDPLPDWLTDRKRNKINNLNHQIDQLSEGIIKIKNEKEEILDQLTEKAKIEKSYKEEFNQKEKKLNDNKEKIKRLRKEIIEYESEIMEIRNNESKELDEFNKLITEVNKDIEEHERKIKNYEKKNQSIIEDKIEKEIELEGIKKEKEKLETKNEELRTKLSGKITGTLDYFELFTYTKKAKDDIAELDKNMIKKLIQRLVKLIEKHYKNKPLNIKRSITVTKKVLEIKYGYKGRIYLIKNNNGYHICRVGQKNSQDRDIDWIKSRF